MTPARALRLLAIAALIASATFTLGAPPASAAEVGTEAALRAAFADPSETTVVLTADIVLTDCTAGDVGRPGGAAPLTLSGPFTITQTCPDERVIRSEDVTGALTINGATITGGQLVDTGLAMGGGVYWQGEVTLNEVTITNNSTRGPDGGGGGGVFVEGTLTVARSSISNNTAGSVGDAGGGGGGLGGFGTLTVTDSLLEGNTAEGGATGGGDGGAIAVVGDSVVEHSTLTGNRALTSLDTMDPAAGGAIVTTRSLTLVDSTVTGNAALGPTSLAGGVFHGGDTLIAYSTIVGNSAAAGANLRSLRNDPDLGEGRVFGSVIANPLGGGTNCGPDPSAAGVSQGYNFSDDDSCNLDATGDRQSAGDPELGALADNGGPTPTMLPADTSPLLDAIPDAACETGIASGLTDDQRGVTRPQGTGCDIGAVEVEAASTEPGDSGTPGGSSGTPASPRFTG